MARPGRQRRVGLPAVFVGLVLLAACGGGAGSALPQSGPQDVSQDAAAAGGIAAPGRDTPSTATSSTATSSTATTGTRTAVTTTSPGRGTSPKAATTAKAGATTPKAGATTPKAGVTAKAGGDPRSVVARAIKDLDKHGPYRLTSSGNDPDDPDVCSVVSPGRFDETVHGPDGSVSRFIEIGSRTWTRLDSGPWENSERVDGIACSISTAMSIRNGTEKTANGAAVRQITGTTRLLGTDYPYTARVDRAGRLLLLELRVDGERMSYRVTYDPSIAVVPPI